MGTFLKEVKKRWILTGIISGLIFLSASGATAGEELLPFIDVSTDVRRGVTFEYQIHPTLPPYAFHLIGNQEGNFIERIDISPGDDPTVIQSLGATQSEAPPRGQEYFVAQDLNFDGYLDIKLLDWWGATGNEGYFVWLFDPQLKKFVFNKDLSNLCSPRVHPESHQITTTSVGGMAGMIHDSATYEWEENKLVLVKEEKQDWIQDKKYFLKVIHERRNGQLVKVSEEIVQDRGWE